MFTLADNVTVNVGDDCFDYYGMKAGHFSEPSDDIGWARFTHNDGSTDLLNGERVCSMAHARRMGWL